MFFFNFDAYKLMRKNCERRSDESILDESTHLIPKNGQFVKSKLCLLPQRYIVCLMGMMAVLNAYTMRVSLSVAITEMVVHHNKSKHYDPDACPMDNPSTFHAVNDSDVLYNWNEETQGLILSSFYWGYVITHLPGGVLAEIFGGKYTLGIGILSTAIFTLLTPLIIYTSKGDWGVLVALRVVEGLGEGTTYPALNALLAKWVPLEERSRMGSMVYAGAQVGTIISNLGSGAIIQSTRDWSSVFYLFGGLGLLWVVVWTLLCYSSPETHPFISEKERVYLEKELGNVLNERRTIPWKAILTSAPLWALVTAQIGHDWGFFTMVTDLPKYMKDVLKYDVRQNGIVSSLPYIVMWCVSMSSGFLCDWIIKKGYWSITFARKFFTSVASIGPAFFIIGASYSGCDRDLAVVLFTIGMGFMGTFYCGMKVNALDLSPNYAGTLMALVNGIGAFTGIVVPYLVGALTPNRSLKEWRTAFWIVFAVFLVTNFIFVLFGSGKEQWWNGSGEFKRNEDEELQSSSRPNPAR